MGGERVRLKLQKPQMSLMAALVATLVWVQPAGPGRMPVGGDASRFGLGLMAGLSQALAENRVPLWTSLWGYGFPALAESQLGVFYPPHILLFKFLPLEVAYTFDMTLHAAWAALGAWLLARRLGQGQGAAALTAITWVTSGFFLVHEPHHWGWPTGAWLPWIFLAGLGLMQGTQATLRQKALGTVILAATMAMPVLTGHFQLGFIGMVSLGIFWLAMILSHRAHAADLGSPLPNLPYLFLAFGVALAFSLVQVLPTWDLAQQANQQRDWEYLSGFATPPTHLVGLVLPALGRTVTFWRPLLWDQFHTSPEELFFYVGLVPLWLAGLAVARLGRSDAVVKALSFTLLAVLLLAAGPYVPGFSMLVRLPGFSFFRAPARWTLAATLILATLAGHGLELVRLDPRRAARGLRRFCLICLLLIGSAVGLIELSARLTSTRPGQESAGLGVINQARRFLIPAWADRQTVQDWVRRSRANDATATPAYAKPYTNLALTSFNRDRMAAYKAEVLPQIGLITALLAVAALVGLSPAAFTTGLAVVMLADLAMLSQLRSIETAPLAGVAMQSPVMGRLEQLSSSSRWPMAVWGDLGNLPMAVGASPLRAYRTMDIPVMPLVNDRLMRSFDEQPLALARLAGVGVLVFDPPTWSQIRGKVLSNQKFEEINDPTLWAWMTTSRQAAQGPTTFGLVHLSPPLGRAWRVEVPPGAEADLAGWTSPGRIDTLAAQATPMEVDRPSAEEIRITAATKGPELWLISQWAAPGWQATLSKTGTAGETARITPMQGGWQGVAVPAAGTWTLGLRYTSAAYSVGFRISTIAWSAALAGGLMLWRKPNRPNHLIIPSADGKPELQPD